MVQKIKELQQQLHETIFYNELVPYLEPMDENVILSAIRLFDEILEKLNDEQLLGK